MNDIDEMIAEVRAGLFRYEEKPDPFEFHHSPGVVQLYLTMWVPGRGWLATRRGISVCNLSSGELIRDHLSDEEVLALEAKTGYRAMMHALKREELNPDGTRSRAPEEGRQGPDRDQGHDQQAGQDR